jgi:hypothetical protein
VVETTPPSENEIETPVLGSTTVDGSTSAPAPTVGGASPDPEPLCSDCGCNVTADHESIGGWLHRVSPWRCTICDWEAPVNPIEFAALGDKCSAVAPRLAHPILSYDEAMVVERACYDHVRRISLRTTRTVGRA